MNEEVVLIKTLLIYKSAKEKYPKYVVLIKVGNFYEIYGEEAYIIHNLFNYKIRKEKNYIRVGFPLIASTKVFDKLKKFKINFIVIDGDNVEKVRFNKNAYDTFFTNGLSIDDRIQTIEEKLAILRNSKNINEILDKIEEIL